MPPTTKDLLAKGSEGRSDDSSSVTRPRVLVVDDDESVRRVTQLVLQGLGVAADLSESGEEAVEMVRTSSYRLVLMDCEMPGMDGLQATRHIRELPAGRELVIVAVTGHALPSDRERVLAAGMDDLVSKPIRPETFQTLLEQHVLMKTQSVRGCDAPVACGYNGRPAGCGQVAAHPEAARPSSGSDVPRAQSEFPPSLPSPGGGQTERDAIPSLDPMRVAELRRLSPDRSVLPRLVKIFREQSAGQLEAVRAAGTSADPAALHMTAHKLAGSAINIGASRLSFIARALEALGQAGTTEGSETLLHELEGEAERAWRLLDDELTRG